MSFTGRQIRAIRRRNELLFGTGSGTPARPSTALQRYPASRSNPECSLWAFPDDTTAGRACRDDPSCHVALRGSPNIYGYYVPGGPNAFGDGQTVFPGAFPISDEEYRISAVRAARDAARGKYENGEFRGYGGYGGGLYSGALTLFGLGVFRNAPSSDLTNFLFHPGDAVSATDPTTMIDKPSGWGPASSVAPSTGQCSLYLANGVAAVRDKWTEYFVEEYGNQLDAFVPDGGGEVVRLCYDAATHDDNEDVTDVRNLHNNLFVSGTGWVRQTDFRNHVQATRPDGTPTNRSSTETIYRDADGKPSTLDEFLSWCVAQGFWDGVLPLPDDIANIYVGTMSDFGYELGHLIRARMEHGMEEAFLNRFRARFPGCTSSSNYDFMHRVPTPGDPTAMEFSGYLRWPRLSTQALVAYGPNDTAAPGAATIDIETRWAAIEAKMAYIDPTRQAIAWVFLGGDGSQAEIGFGEDDQNLEVLKRLWASGFNRFYGWGNPAAGTANVAHWHANVWTPFRAWVAEQLLGSTNRIVVPRIVRPGDRGRPTRSDPDSKRLIRTRRRR